jgi:tripartite-type tricarboxylate transporter receptor subunit TctC
LGSFLLGGLSLEAFALEYPTKPITLIVGFAAGGGNSLAAQVIAGYLTKKHKWQINVVNKPGGNSVPAVHEVYSSRPDGYTLLVDASSSSSIQYATMKELPYKVEDRTFIARCISSPNVYFSSPARPWKTLREIADFLKRDPENFKWAALGNTSLTTFNVYLFLNATGADISRTKKVDVKGGPDLFASIAGGHTDFSQYGVGATMPLIEAGKLRPVSVISTGDRLKRLPGVPTMKEAGFPNTGLIFWIGLSGPPGLPREIVEKWNQRMQEASTDPEFIEMSEKVFWSPDYQPSEEFRRTTMAECKNLKELSQRMGLSQ